MSLFHKHKWVEKERFYVPPTDSGNLDGLKMQGDGAKEIWKRMCFGVTTIYFVCEECGKTKFVEVLGSAITYLDQKED